MGNLYAKRDWGHAKDYVIAMWKILQQKKPEDYVIATGNTYSIKQFIGIVSKELKMKISWRGKGLNEVGFYNGKKIIKCDKNYFRPLDVQNLLGNANKARRELNWKPNYNIASLVKEMVKFEMKNLL